MFDCYGIDEEWNCETNMSYACSLVTYHLPPLLNLSIAATLPRTDTSLFAHNHHTAYISYILTITLQHIRRLVLITAISHYVFPIYTCISCSVAEHNSERSTEIPKSSDLRPHAPSLRWELATSSWRYAHCVDFVTVVMHSLSGYQDMNRVCSVTYRHEQRRVILFKSGSETTRSEIRCKYDLSDGKVYAKAGRYMRRTFCREQQWTAGRQSRQRVYCVTRLLSAYLLGSLTGLAPVRC